MIGTLQYAVHNRPNIALAIGIVGRFSTNPKENHIIVVKRIMWYLKVLKIMNCIIRRMKSLS